MPDLRVGIYDSTVFRKHDSGAGHPERPERLDAIRIGLLDADLEGRLESIAPREATRDDVNRAIRAHLSPSDLAVVVIAKDAEGLKRALVADAFSPITYDGEKPAELLAEDKVIGARKLGIRPEAVRITPVEEVFKSSARP